LLPLVRRPALTTFRKVSVTTAGTVQCGEHRYGPAKSAHGSGKG